ncbi:hypothetical protein FA09DRAFT_328530 [Tilletiopsis washingtonensis]|jgi:hypothetical protein|uniref:Uncharacterized protein n=1 Tax=Tilletiopsis washingtonensis TaxID=58919 RepID=A0A316ZET9_9BASI|nr:hypothetical protein FA09DRAFT_328530 [Tilletiopsis washingtonensis]PWN99746.1 hypothetical protein FA09DRAFT_328530 [Tilletiopsis washingtonensis]
MHFAFLTSLLVAGSIASAAASENISERQAPALPGSSSGSSSSGGATTPPNLPGVSAKSIVVPFDDPTSFDRGQGLSAQTFAALQAASGQAISQYDAGLEPTVDDPTVFKPVDLQGVKYSQIQTQDGKLILAAGGNGNFAVGAVGSAGAGVVLQAVDNIVAQDDQGNIFVYWPATMKSLGVSRIRIVDPDFVPKGAQLVTLAPLAVPGQSSGVYQAVDTLGGNFFPIVCTYVDGSASKVFLAADPEKGVAALKSQSNQAAITGGVVQDCAYMPFVSPGYAGN